MNIIVFLTLFNNYKLKIIMAEVRQFKQNCNYFEDMEPSDWNHATYYTFFVPQKIKL